MIYIIGLILHLVTWGKSHMRSPGAPDTYNDKGEIKCVICGAWFEDEQSK